MKIEEWQTGLLEVESLAKAYEETKKELYRVKAEAKKEAIEEGAAMAELFIEKISEGIGLKAEEKREEEKVEQASESES